MRVTSRQATCYICPRTQAAAHIKYDLLIASNSQIYCLTTTRRSQKISILRHVHKVVLAIYSLHPGLKETNIIMNYFSQCNCTISCQMLHFVTIHNKFRIILELDKHSKLYLNATKFLPMASSNTAVSPVLTHWSYCSLAPSHRCMLLTQRDK